MVMVYTLVSCLSVVQYMTLHYFLLHVMVYRDCGKQWDILFNPTKSQLITFGGPNPTACKIHIDHKAHQ